MKYWGLETQIQRLEFRIGKQLEKTETSKSGAYAIMSKSGDIPLRVSLIKDLAWLAEDDSRYISECWITN